MKSNETIRDRYTPRQYFQKLIREGHDATHASSIVAAIFGS